MKFTKKLEAIEDKFCSIGPEALNAEECKCLIQWLQWQIDNPKGQGFIANNWLEIKWLQDRLLEIAIQDQLPPGVAISCDIF